MRKYLIIGGVALMLAATAVPARAQSADMTGRVVGTVIDQQNAITLPGVPVTVVATNQDIRFNVALLGPLAQRPGGRCQDLGFNTRLTIRSSPSSDRGSPARRRSARWCFLRDSDPRASPGQRWVSEVRPSQYFPSY